MPDIAGFVRTMDRAHRRHSRKRTIESALRLASDLSVAVREHLIQPLRLSLNDAMHGCRGVGEYRGLHYYAAELRWRGIEFPNTCTASDAMVAA